MSTSFIPDAPIPIEEIRAFNRNGVKAETDENGLVLTDGRNGLRVYAESESDPMMFERYGRNDPTAIVEAVESAFGVELIPEFEPEFERLLEAKLEAKP